METYTEVSRHEPLPPTDGNDPVLSHLSQALAAYRDTQAANARRAEQLQEVETQLGLEQARNLYLAQESETLSNNVRALQAEALTLSETNEGLQSQLEGAQALNTSLEQERQSLLQELETLRAQDEARAAEHQALQTQVARERERADRNRDLANKMAEVVRDLHTALFGGNVQELILRACMTLTDATCGLYITRPDHQSYRVRAAIGVDGYPDKPASDFIKALCDRVLSEENDDDTLVLPNEAPFSDFPPPANEGEQFRNAVVAPVVLLKNFSGVVIVGNKKHGDFQEEDVEVLLSVGDQAAVAVENEQLQDELQQAYLSIVGVLADAAEAKDPYTHGHCELVSRYARLVARQMALPDEERSVVCFAALLHDIGKIGVSDGILHKVGRLLPEERDLIRSHVRIGYEMLSKVPALQEVAHVVLYHHEWYDGSGYPNGLKGESIPVAARIVSVVDAYCAMITRRSYKEEYSAQRAQEELIQYSGTQFDPKVVQAFLHILSLPEAQWEDDDYAAECGMLPGYGRVKRQIEAQAEA